MDSVQTFLKKYHYVLYIAVICLCVLEISGDVCFSQWVKHVHRSRSAWMWFALGGFLYLIMGLLFGATLLSKQIATVNTLWQAGSVVFGILWGIFYFKEYPTNGEWVGFGIILVGIFVLASASSEWKYSNWWNQPSIQS